MHFSDRELRKLLNKEWDVAKHRIFGWRAPNSLIARRRYQDVSRILKEAKKAKEGKHGN